MQEQQELLLKILKNTEEIQRTLKAHEVRLDHIENDFGTRLDHIENDFGTRLDHIENDFGTRLQNVENIVTKIEKEHGDKLQVLFDYFVDQDKKEKASKLRIKKNEETLDEHDTRLFALEFHKEKLASN